VASSLFEAAAMALARFRRTRLSESALGPATRLKDRGTAAFGSP
jgi:predicted membrane-bound dolichyl-phosphate-mannose-protein mannosyltransferase